MLSLQIQFQTFAQIKPGTREFGSEQMDISDLKTLRDHGILFIRRGLGPGIRPFLNQGSGNLASKISGI